MLVIASTLESVVESNPVADLVCRGTTQIVRGSGTTGKSRVKKNDAVLLWSALVTIRECRVAEDICAIERDTVEVESLGTAAAELFLHFRLFGATLGNLPEPLGVRSPGGVDEFETETSSVEVPIQDRNLVPDLLISETRCA